MTSAVVFAYHNVGVRCLSVLLAHGIDVKLVVTHEDAAGENIWFGSVRALAQEHGIPVVTPADPHDEATMVLLRAAQPDFLFSFYYRSMLKPAILGIPRRGGYNMHGSLLPKYRGRVPINWAVLHGETESGATLHEMVEKPDAGRIVDQMPVPILPDDTAQDVFAKVLVAAEIVLHRALPALIDGSAVLRPMNLQQGSYFGGRKAEDGRIDWSRPAAAIHNLVRAVTHPYPGAFSDLRDGRLVIWRTLPTAERGAPGRPSLFAVDGHLVVRCADGVIMKLLAAELNGVPLGADLFRVRFGGAELPLTA
ncbi:MAG: formyltransferase [Nevskiaceae bacterium]|nr:MAG: formyltransferase [Nevskiaceae bacterium]